MNRIKLLISMAIILLLTPHLFDGENIFQRLYKRYFVKAKASSEKRIEPGLEKTEGQSKPKKSIKDLTMQELLEDIKDTLESEEEILEYFPELKMKTDPEGKAYYTYMDARLEGLDREKLEKIWVRVHNEATRIRTERINRQLEQIRNIQRMQTSIPRAPTQYTPPQPPRVPTLTTPPARISTPPSAPRLPPLPPPERR